MEVLVALLCVLVILWIIWRKQHLSLFKKQGIPGPPPNIFFGNLIELYTKGPIECHKQWVQKYGKVLGYYNGMKPVLLVTDPHMLKNIFIKDFSKFMNREAFNPLFEYNPNDKFGQSVINLPGQAWKEVRSVLTPTFTTAKMKQMSGSMKSSIEDMIEILSESVRQSKRIDIHDVYQRLTMDVITRTAFGVRSDVQTNPKSRLLRATQLLFMTPYKDPLIFIGLSFPFLRNFCTKLQNLMLAVLNRGVKPNMMLRKGIIEVLEHRRSNPQAKKTDLLQLMIDTTVVSGHKDIDLNKLEAGSAESEAKNVHEENTGKVVRAMSDDEIIASAFVVLLAGYETTSTSLAFTTYLLAKHQDVQEKLYQEIYELIKNGHSMEYATVNKLQYLDQVFNESLRVFPPVYLFTNRFALEDVTYDNIKISKGMIIQAPVVLLHSDPTLWPEPEKFKPERFCSKPNTDGISFLPFGVGPRNCLGMRFAQLEAKLALAHVVYNFKILLSDSEKDSLDVTVRIRTLSPTKGVQVQLVPRDVEPPI